VAPGLSGPSPSQQPKTRSHPPDTESVVKPPTYRKIKPDFAKSSDEEESGTLEGLFSTPGKRTSILSFHPTPDIPEDLLPPVHTIVPMPELTALKISEISEKEFYLPGQGVIPVNDNMRKEDVVGLVKAQKAQAKMIHSAKVGLAVIRKHWPTPRKNS